MNPIVRIVRAFREGRLLSGALKHLSRPFAEPLLRFRTGLPAVSGSALPAIVTSGAFSQPEGLALKDALDAALTDRSKLPPDVRSIKGMSGQRYRTLINTLIENLDHARYLEIGSWLGSTAAAAMYGNRVQAVCIDNWSQFTGTREQFLANMEQARSSGALRLVEQDFRTIDYGALGKFNVYFFDGPHRERDHEDGIVVVQPCLEDRFILIVDDWNWRAVRLGTMRGLLAATCRVESGVQVRTTFDDSEPAVEFGRSDWHNGYFIAVVHRS